MDLYLYVTQVNSDGQTRCVYPVHDTERNVFNLPVLVFQVADQLARPLVNHPRVSRGPKGDLVHCAEVGLPEPSLGLDDCCHLVSEVAQSCPTLCDPMNCSLPGSSIYGIFQARKLECVAISFSRRSSQPRD